ncbi:hypothetical protein OHS70_24315 [Streptomyces sp. NBC_00390]|uniref:hypothetical protein n=1 Tax=Streptomyces sp. NBC_00390 TaxID=2975736 RepID=UPI002E1AC963
MRRARVLTRRRPSLALALCVAMAVASCTAGKEERDDGVPAAKVCDASFSADARDALGRISTADRYQESVLPLDKAVTRLRGHADTSTSRSTICTVHTAEQSAQDPLFRIEFVHVDTGVVWPPALDPDDSYYPLGLYADSSDEQAFIAFRCSRGLRKNGPPVVAGVLEPDSRDPSVKLSDAERRHAHMVMLHSAARAMAGKLGCLAEAGLPAKAPEPSPHRAYRKPPSLETLEREFAGDG